MIKYKIFWAGLIKNKCQLSFQRPQNKTVSCKKKKKNIAKYAATGFCGQKMKWKGRPHKIYTLICEIQANQSVNILFVW